MRRKALIKLMRIFINLGLMLFRRIHAANKRADNHTGAAQRAAHAAAAADAAAHAGHHADSCLGQAQLKAIVAGLHYRFHAVIACVMILLCQIINFLHIVCLPK